MANIQHHRNILSVANITWDCRTSWDVANTQHHRNVLSTLANNTGNRRTSSAVANVTRNRRTSSDMDNITRKADILWRGQHHTEFNMKTVTKHEYSSAECLYYTLATVQNKTETLRQLFARMHTNRAMYRYKYVYAWFCWHYKMVLLLPHTVWLLWQPWWILKIYNSQFLTV